MSFIQKIIKHFNKQCETNEDHVEKELKTRYYRVNLRPIFQSVIEILGNDKQAIIVSESIERGEIAVEINRGKKIFVMITIITLKPYETAVDIVVSTEQTSIFGVYPSLKEEIIRLYNELDKRQPNIGAGKHPME